LFASAEGASPHRQGHRLLRQAEGDEVSPIYEMLIETPAGAGSVVMSEWARCSRWRADHGPVMFDTAAFRDLVPPG
jgi:hypothetical protein